MDKTVGSFENCTSGAGSIPAACHICIFFCPFFSDYAPGCPTLPIVLAVASSILTGCLSDGSNEVQSDWLKVFLSLI